MAKKRGKMTGRKKATTITAGKAKAKAGARRPNRPPAKAPATATPKTAAKPTPPARAQTAPSRASAPLGRVAAPLVARAERLYDDIQRSKITHPDPWTYTTKARVWVRRAEQLVADASAGRDVRRDLEGLAAEVEGDRDFREAHRLF
ncbi:MAG: hypothetical protein DMD79_10025 [Candidatus Rokuibacteriota bacterium]|nr:MAG: hypothetical protein DMD79_10025 [Candidatus Rokubacteria bacterium]